MLEYWHASAAQLMFVYLRSDGALTQIGRGRIQQATPNMLKLDLPDGQLEILVGDAAFEFGAMANVDALLVCLRNEDRLYFWEGAARLSRGPQ